MALVVITRTRTVRLRKAYLVEVPQADLVRLRLADEEGETEEFIDAVLEPYYTAAITSSTDEVLEQDNRDLRVSWEVVDDGLASGDW